MKKKLLLKILTCLMLSVSILPISRTFAEELNIKNYEGKMVIEEVNAGAREGYVEVPDASLKKAINKAIGQSSDSDIPKWKLEKLTELYGMVTDISNLEGIQYCTNLKELNLQCNKISDISLLKNLKNLRSLSLNVNQIEDITPLAELPNLRVLYLGHNKIKDISPLSNLKNLRELSIRTLPIKDIKPLENLSGLRELDLARNRIDNLNIISKLTSLRSIDLYDNGLEDINILKDLKRLEWITLERNNIKDISILKDFKYLSGLIIDDNKLYDISPLSNLPELEMLHITNNNIADMSPLATLPKLGRVELDNQKITLKSKEVNGRFVMENPIKSLNGYGRLRNLSNDGELKKFNRYLTWNNLKDENIKEISFDFNEELQINGKNVVFSGEVVQPIQFNKDALKLEDINKDKTIDISDLAALGVKYNSKSTEEGWNEELDLNKDDVIDIFDLAIISKSM